MKQLSHQFSYPFVHRLGDASEGTVETAPTAGVLDEDVSDVDTSFPLLSEGLYDMEIQEVTEESNKAKTGTNLKIVVVTTKDSVSPKGEALNRGMKLTSYIGLTETEKYNTDSIKRNVAGFVQAVGCGITKVKPFDQFKGKIVRVKVSIRPAGKDKTGVEREAANDLKWVPAGN